MQRHTLRSCRAYLDEVPLRLILVLLILDVQVRANDACVAAFNLNLLFLQRRQYAVEQVWPATVVRALARVDATTCVPAAVSAAAPTSVSTFVSLSVCFLRHHGPMPHFRSNSFGFDVRRTFVCFSDRHISGV